MKPMSIKACSLPDCGAAHKGHGYCNKHYQRWKKYGDPEHLEVKNPGIKGGSISDRVEAIGWTPTPQGCLEWKGYIAKDGYGILRVGGNKSRRGQVHRLYYADARQPVPRHLVVRHKCDNRKCVNLDHMELGTSLDNNRDRMVRGRSSVGEAHWCHKLTEDQVAEIRLAYAPGVRSQQSLADEYGVSQPVISAIVRGRAWNGS